MPRDLVAFYGASQANGFMSNFYYAPFVATVEGREVTFWTMEAWIMLHKALLFGAKTTRDKMLKKLEKDPGVSGAHAFSMWMKQEGRNIPNFADKIWRSKRPFIALNGLRRKFEDPRMARLLVATGSARLAEASPRDAIWGTGLDTKATAEAWKRNELGYEGENPCENPWPGTNLLGQYLETVRNELI